MFFKNFPHMPARLTGFGHPFHGLVQGSQLTLPNSTVMSYRQPDGGGGTVPSKRDGDTYRVALGAPPISRTPDQQSMDTANGWQWWNEAILAGADRQLYGTSMNGRWVYADPNGDRWAVAFPEDSYSFDSPFSETVSLHRFGVFEATPEQHDYTVTLNDWEQSTPVLTLSGGDRFGKVFLVSTSPTGDQAIFAIARDSDQLIRYAPLGFLLLSISGAGDNASLSLTVLRNRAQTLGTYSETPAPTPITRYAAFYATQTQTTQSYADCNDPVVMETRTQANSTGWLSSPSHPEVSDPADFVEAQGYSSNPVTVTYSRTGRILAMWFNGTTIEEVTWDVTDVTEINSPLPSISASGERVVTYNYLGNCDTEVASTTDNRTMEISRVTTTSQTITHTLRYGANSITFTVTSADDDNRTKDHLNYTITGSYYLETNQYGHADSENNTINDTLYISGQNKNQDWGVSGAGLYQSNIDSSSDLIAGTMQWTWARLGFTPGKVLHVCRPANHLIHVNITTIPVLVPNSSQDWDDPYAGSYDNLQAAFCAPGAYDASQQTLTGPHIHGSFDLVNGAMARGYPDPVCWV